MASKVTSNGTAPKASKVRRGKAFMARAKAMPHSSSSSSSSSNPQAVPLSIPGAKPPGRPLRLPPLRLELVGTRPLQKRWLRKPKLLRLRRLRRMMMATCTFACRGKRWRQWIPGSPRRFSTMFLRAISSSAAAGTRVAAVSCRFRHHFVRVCLGLATWRVWRHERRCGRDRTAFRGADATCRGASCGSQCVRGC